MANYYVSSITLPAVIGPDYSAFEINLMPSGIFRWRYWDELRFCIAESQDFYSYWDCFNSIRWVVESDNLTVSYGTMSEWRIAAYLIYNYNGYYRWRLFDQWGKLALQSPTIYAEASRCWANIAKLKKADNKTVEGAALNVDNYFTRIEPRPVSYSAIVIGGFF